MCDGLPASNTETFQIIADEVPGAAVTLVAVALVGGCVEGVFPMYTL